MVAALIVCAICVPSAWAQDYPSKPIKIIVPVAPGGLMDSIGRIVGEYITKKTGQQVIVENRSGASGNIAMDALAKSNPDGYTLAIANTGDLAVNPFLYKNLSFDARKDLVPIALIADSPQLLVVNAQLPANTLQEFIAYAKARPGKVNYGSAGVGSLTNIGALLLARLAGIQIVNVPYRGMVPAVTDMVGGRIQMMHTALGGIVSQVRAGKVRVLAVAAPERWTDALPDVPSSAEAGLPEYKMSIWFGLVAPRNTPAPIVKRLNGYMRAMVADPDTKKRLVDGFARPASMGVEEFQAYVRQEADRWGGVVHELGVKLE